MADKELVNPGGAFGYTGAANLGYQMGGYFKASAAVVAGNVVFINTDGTISPAAVGTTVGLCIGIAPNAIAAGANGYVVTHGIVDNAIAQGTVTAGVPVMRSATTAGAVLSTAAPAAGEAIGFPIATTTTGLAATIFVCKAL